MGVRTMGPLQLALAAGGLALCAALAQAAPQTVCTITVNSPDEKESFRRHLPEGQYRFVELVERGKPDWLAASCRARVACDVLIVSAHYDGGNVFFSDRLDASEYLTVSELERVSCSDSCSTLFSRLKEVYLFGCNTLRTEPLNGASAEVVRSLVREGHSRERAERELRSLTAAHGESSRDRMREIFEGVPVIYGFSSTAPLGPIAGATLDRYLRGGGQREVARGRTSARLLAAFAPFGMTAAQGVAGADVYAAARADMCQFADERPSSATKLAFVHQLLQRHVGEARLYLDRIQRLMDSLDAAARSTPAVAQELEEIGRDAAARERVLDYARETDRPAVRVRLLDLARDVGWLSDGDRQLELAMMLGEFAARRQLGVAEINLACSLNQDRRLDGVLGAPADGAADDAGHAALRACLGGEDDRQRTVRALLSERDDERQLAQAYLRHRPLTSEAELRQLTGGIAEMASGDAQAHALEALGRHYVSDPEVLGRLVRLFAETPSAAVQAAIAGILIRADLRALARPDLAQTLRAHRHPAADGRDSIVDALLGVLQSR